MRVFRIALWAAFSGLLVAIAAILLPACGLLTFLSFVTPELGWNFCRPPLALTVKRSNEALVQRAQELEIEIARHRLACLKAAQRSSNPLEDGASELASASGS